MRVEEKSTDRKAEVHLRAVGIVNELKEYDQYVDEVDGAICCYVGMEEGMSINIVGKFIGTTLAIAWDGLVDGVLRGANNWYGKAVSRQTCRKFGFDRFLYEVDGDVLETVMKADPASGMKTSQEDTPETLGTIELRLYVLRKFGEEHAIDNVRVYHSQKNADDQNGQEKVTLFKTIAPDLKMVFEEDCAALEVKEANRHKAKLEKLRPGKEPWAIFRFHYRTKEAIEARDMKLTFEAKTRSIETYELQLEPAPALLLGAKPSKGDDADSSTVASSIPDTPIKSAEVFTLSPAPRRKKQPPKFPVSFSGKDDHPFTPNCSPSPDHRRQIEDDDKQKPEKTPGKQPSDNKAGSATSKATVAAREDEKPQEQSIVNGTTSADMFKENGEAVTEDQAPRTPLITNIENEVIDSGKATTPTQAREEAQEPAEPTTPPSEKATDASGPATKSTGTASTANMLPAKRSAPAQLPGPPETKRNKPAPITPPVRTATATPTVSTTLKLPTLAEKRKQLETARKKRETLAEKRAQVAEKFAPYKQQMEDKMRRVNEELEEETRAYNEELREFRDEVAMFNEFKKAEGGN